ncbi:uncharacterized protein [Hyperolius riggenbachi]|uniref:uncharacterized protein isoform X2 n=1 Tax=Hyperolius riggenbachi TaxID=752182 RepID=UPI0035A34800
MRLLILLFCFQGITTSSGQNCTYQVTTLAVEYGGSVTIPCSYSDPEDWEDNTKIEFHWWETSGRNCSSSTEKVLSGNVSERYKGRLTIERDSNWKRTENLIITELKNSDGPRFCCGISSVALNFTLNNSFGTLLQFTDGVSVTQLDEVIGVPGEEVLIPCHYPEEDSGPAQEVTWYIPDTPHTCDDHTRILHTWKHADVVNNRFSLVNFPQDISLRIHKLKTFDYLYYCCEVNTTKSGRLLSEQITMVIIGGYTSLSVSVYQHAETTVQEGGSVTLNCSYTIDDPITESEVVRVSVYWRVGNETGPYAYHPHQEMVHPNYKERATITGTLDLFIEDVQMADNSSFYCIVVIKLCIDLHMKSQMSSAEVILAASVASIFLIVLIAAALLVCYIQYKGQEKPV